MFRNFNAWFAPELDAYKATWTKNGGEEQALEKADIAFVTDRTPSSSDRLKPTMKILRPDWIEDSVRGGRRLSLQRYKGAFPGLRRLDSSQFEGHLAVGLDALASTNILSLTPASDHLHQPETGIEELSYSDGSAAYFNPSATMGRTIDTSGRGTSLPELPQESTLGTSTQFMGHCQTSHLSSSQKEKEERDEQEKHVGTPRESSGTYEYAMDSQLDKEQKRTFVERTTRPLPHPEVIVVGASSTAGTLPSVEIQPTATRKRQLPETVIRRKRVSPAVRDMRNDKSFFDDSSPEREVIQQYQRGPDERLRQVDDGENMRSIETESLPSLRDPVPDIASPLERVIARQRAEEYLKNTMGRLNKDTNGPYSGKDPQLYIIDIPSTDISLQLKYKGK
ncbi:hypothetical protein BC939DRAFT_458581 [Gamsiella multidivaricata]|uniref:uncharacterized protein n=1 Tax=Gamsiella multidivaricata TaxID=101098 RepID=UPI00221ED946|nr:uncharacterized protein BC939DRAFT_458581 [Gamsiella multidivaricata]KAI7820188.1 hypothetical protein BC939DRAFT_458581 [Gamsiella multidivaricata]